MYLTLKLNLVFVQSSYIWNVQFIYKQVIYFHQQTYLKSTKKMENSQNKYKEGNNRPSSVNRISLVHNQDKTGNKYYTKDNTNTWETKPKCENRCHGRLNFSCCGLAPAVKS